MLQHTNDRAGSRCTRRCFLKQSTTALSALAVTRLAAAHPVHTGGGDLLRLGLIGCGGRGSGAVGDALTVDRQTRLVAMADAFAWRIDESLASLRAGMAQGLLAIQPDQLDVPPERRFVGFEAYRQLLSCDLDVVLITVPSHFTPIYLKAAIEAGKHVFCEKTHAVDAPGVRSVLEVTELARQKGLSVVSGLAWRYDLGVRETMKRVHDGAIGEIRTIQEVCNTGSLRSLARKDGMTEMEYQIYNWYDFNWLSADLPGLNLVHNVDKGAWALHDVPPICAWGMGGREVRKGPTFGDVFDHHATVFEYGDGVRMYAFCRQINFTKADISDLLIGTRGVCNLLENRIEGEVAWRYDGPAGNRFQLEQAALLSSIRAGTPINNGLYMARSSLLALMATWCSHTGQEITWEQAFHSQHQLNPTRYAFDAPPPTQPGPDGNYPIAIPGVTKFQ